MIDVKSKVLGKGVNAVNLFFVLVITCIVAYLSVNKSILLYALGSISAIAAVYYIFKDDNKFVFFMILTPLLNVFNHMVAAGQISPKIAWVFNVLVTYSGYMFLVIFGIKMIFKRERMKYSFLDIIIFLFFCIYIIYISASNHGYIQVSLTAFNLNGITISCYFIGRMLINNESRVEKFYDYIVATGTILALYGIFQNVVGLLSFDRVWVSSLNSGIYSGQVRIFSTLDSSFSLAIVLAIASVIAAYKIIKTEKAGKVALYSVCLFIICTALIFTYVRTAWIVALIGILPMFFRKRSKAFYFIIIVLIAAAVIIKFGNGDIISRMSSISNISGDDSFNTRLYNWRILTNSMKNVQIFGYGIGSTGGISQYFSNLYAFNYIASDNQYISYFVEMGLLGLTFFAVILITYFANGIKAFLEGKEAESRFMILLSITIIAAISIANITNNYIQMFPLNYLYWLFLGVGYNTFISKTNDERIMIKHENSYSS